MADEDIADNNRDSVTSSTATKEPVLLQEPILEQEDPEPKLNPLLDDMAEYATLAELADKVVKPLHETAVFDDSEQTESDQL